MPKHTTTIQNQIWKAKTIKKKLIHFPWCNWHTRFIHETSQIYRPVCMCEYPRICRSHIYVNLFNIPSLRAFSWKWTFPLCLWEEIGCLINCLNVSQSLNTSDRMCTKALRKKKENPEHQVPLHPICEVDAVTMTTAHSAMMIQWSFA